jgi:hypothetical protein
VGFPEELFQCIPASKPVPESEPIPAFASVPASKLIPAFTPTPSFEQIIAIERIPASKEVPASEPLPTSKPIPAVGPIHVSEEIPVEALHVTNQMNIDFNIKVGVDGPINNYNHYRLSAYIWHKNDDNVPTIDALQ